MYPGDDKMYGATQMRKGMHGINETLLVKCKDNISRVSCRKDSPERREDKAMCKQHAAVQGAHDMNSMKKVHNQICGEVLID